MTTQFHSNKKKHPYTTEKLVLLLRAVLQNTDTTVMRLE